jgi:glycolate dehydrogenase FAD-binding subunit
MNLVTDRLVRALEAELGVDLVTRDAGVLSAHVADGKEPALVCSPATPEQVGAALRVCEQEKAAVIPWAGATAISVGNPPREACAVMKLTRMNQVIEHDHANLTATVQNGITLAALQKVLLPQRQFLPFDAPFPDKATIGGTVAANLNGPRRGYYGSIRDLVIGMKVTLISGARIKAGGKVVKNVAGYDMCKLFTGSLGTLGVVSEIILRIAPIPEATATVIVSGGLTETLQLTDALSRSVLLPAAAMLMNSPQQHGAENQWQAAIRCEGFEVSVSRQLSDTEKLARGYGLGTAILRGTGHEELWGGLRDFPLATDRCVYRVTVPRAAVGKFIEAVGETTASLPPIVSDMVTGTVWLSWAANHQATAIWPQLISLATAHRGHAVMFSAPFHVKAGLDIWGPPPPTFPLMRKIKQQFDPKGLLNPGRYIAGL